MSGRDVPERSRETAAHARVSMLASTSQRVAANDLKKGDVLGTARFAGIQAAKNATSMLPLSISVPPMESVSVDFVVGSTYIDVEARVSTSGDERVQIQAMTAATVAALTIFDMCKAVDRTMVVSEVVLGTLPSEQQSSDDETTRGRASRAEG